MLAPLGLLGRIGQASCTLEPFHRTPAGDRVADCLAKHRFFCRELRRRKAPPPLPTQWIISSGRPSTALAGWWFAASPLGAGIYDGPPLSRTRIVVVSELPRTRDTLLVRLMGAGRTLEHAITDLQALPEGAPERRLALPIVIRLRLEIPAEPAKQSKIDREFLMNTLDVDKYLSDIERQGVEKGREKGREEGFARAVLAAYELRFGEPPAALVAAIQGAREHGALQRWLEIVTTGSAEDVAAVLRSARPRKTASPTPKRRSPSPRRPAAAR